MAYGLGAVKTIRWNNDYLLKTCINIHQGLPQPPPLARAREPHPSAGLAVEDSGHLGRGGELLLLGAMLGQTVRRELICHQSVNPFSTQASKDRGKLSLAASNSNRGSNPAQPLEVDADHPISKGFFDFPAIGIVEPEANISDDSVLLNDAQLFGGKAVAAAGHQSRRLERADSDQSQSDFIEQLKSLPDIRILRQNPGRTVGTDDAGSWQKAGITVN